MWGIVGIWGSSRQVIAFQAVLRVLGHCFSYFWGPGGGKRLSELSDSYLVRLVEVGTADRPNHDALSRPYPKGGLCVGSCPYKP